MLPRCLLLAVVAVALTKSQEKEMENCGARYEDLKKSESEGESEVEGEETMMPESEKNDTEFVWRGRGTMYQNSVAGYRRD